MKEKNETVDNFPKEVEHVPPPKATTEGKRGPGLGSPGGSSCRLFSLWLPGSYVFFN